MQCITCNVFAKHFRVCTSLSTHCGDKHFNRFLTFPIHLGEEPSKRWHSWVTDSVRTFTEKLLITAGETHFVGWPWTWTAHPATHFFKFCTIQLEPLYLLLTNSAINIKGNPLRENYLSSKHSLTIKATSWLRNNTNTIMYSGKSLCYLPHFMKKLISFPRQILH